MCLQRRPVMLPTHGVALCSLPVLLKLVTTDEIKFGAVRFMDVETLN